MELITPTAEPVPPPFPAPAVTPLEVALGDGTSIPEQAAWGAYQALKTNDAKLDHPLADGSTLRSQAKASLGSYIREVDAAQRPRFPTYSEQANRSRRTYHRKLFTKPLAEVLDPESFATLETRAKTSLDPDRYRSRQVLKSYLSDLYGQPIPSDSYDHARDNFARKNLGMTGDTSDKAVFAQLQKTHTDEITTEKTMAEATGNLFVSTLEGIAGRSVYPETFMGGDAGTPRRSPQAPTVDAKAEWQRIAPTIPEALRPQAEEQFLRTHREARRLAVKIRPAVDHLESLFASKANTPGGENLFSEEMALAFDSLPDNPTERDAVLGSLARRLKSWPQDQRSVVGRVFGEGITRGTFRGARGVSDAFTTLSATAAADATSAFGINNDPDKPSLAYMKRSEGIRQLEALFYGEGDTLRRAGDSFIGGGIVSASQSLYTIPLSLSGTGGIMILAASFGGNRYQEARMTQPDADKRLQFNAAMVSGAAESLIETGMNTIGLKYLKGTMPSFAGILNRAKITAPLTRAGLGFAEGAVGTAAAEFFEEGAQEAMNRFSQDLASNLSGIDPQTDWAATLGAWTGRQKDADGKWKWELGPEQLETIAAVLPFAFVGGAGASFKHFHYGDRLRKNKAALRMVGVSEERIDAITSALDVEQADVEMKAAFTEGLDLKKAAAQREAFLSTMGEVQRLTEAAGFPMLTQTENDFDGSISFLLALPGTASQTFATQDEAFEAWRGWASEQQTSSMETLLAASTQDAVQFLTGEGQLAENQRIESLNSDLTPDENVKRGGETKEQMRARLEIFALQEGLSMEQVADLAKSGRLNIRARAFAEESTAGVFRATVQLFRGASPLDVAEDVSENTWRLARREGWISDADLVSHLRSLEAATGQAYLRPGLTAETATEGDYLEGLSKVSKEYLLGNIQNESLPETLRRWLEMILALAAYTLENARLITRSNNLMDAVKAGKVDQGFLDIVADSVGLNEDARLSRIEKAYEEQLAAEAMGGFPEISDQLRGKLPHPDTLALENDPLAGNLRRIWDSMKKITRRKTKAGSQVINSQTADSFFLPRGTSAKLDQIRESMNEIGFSFETPAEMIEGLELSLLYNKPQFGTRMESMEGEWSQTGQASYALSAAGLGSLEGAIAAKINAGPKERAALYSTLRDRLAGVLQRFEDSRNGVGPFARKPSDDPAVIEQRRIRETLAEVRAIFSAFPPEVRGRLNIPTDDILAAETDRARVNLIKRAINSADEVLENYLVNEYTEAFDRLIDMARPNVSASKQGKGKLTPLTQRMIAKIDAVIHLSPSQFAVESIKADAGVSAAQEASDQAEPDTEDAREKGEALTEATTDAAILSTFGAFANRSALEMESAFSQLEAIYSTGRFQRRTLDEAQQAERQAMKREVMTSLGFSQGIGQAKHSTRTDASKRRILDLLEGYRLEHSSFHQVMQWFFPKSATAQEIMERARRADRATVRRKINARKDWEAWAAAAFGITSSRPRARINRIVAELSRRKDTGLVIREGIKTATEKLTPEQARAILEPGSKIKTGWEKDRVAMQSLANALRDFNMLPEKDRNRRQFIRFDRVTSRGEASSLILSELEALYYLQLAGQPEYLPSLDKHGFTADVLAQLEASLDPRAEQIGGFLRQRYAEDYEDINPVHQRLFGLDMPQVKNYAPGIFEHMDAKATAGGLDTSGTQTTGVNAMAAGFTKNRQAHMARPRQTNALAAYWAHTEATTYFVEWAELMRDMRAVFRAPEVRRTVEGIYGSRAASVLSTWLDALETDGNLSATNLLAASELTANTLAAQSAIGLTLNIGTLFKQFSAATGALALLPFKKFAPAFVRALRNPANVKNIWDQEMIRQRLEQGFSPEDKRILDAGRMSPSMVMDLLNDGRLPIAYVDAAMTTITGAIAYQSGLADAKAAGLKGAQAEEFALSTAERILVQYAQPATTQDKSLFELNAKGMARALIMFKSDPRQKLAISAQALQLALRGDITAPEAIRRITVSWALYGILGTAGSSLFMSMFRDDADDDWNIEDFLAAAIAGPIAGLGWFGSGLEYIIRASIGTRAFTNSANPIDNAAANLLGGRLLKIAQLYRDDQPITFDDVLGAAKADSSAFALLAGSIDPRLAIVPVALRAAGDAVGITRNGLDLIMGDKDEDEADIIGQAKEEAKKQAAAAKDTRKDDWRDFSRLDPLAQDKRLAELRTTNPALARTLSNKRDTVQLSQNERDLKALPKELREATARQILDALPPAERPARESRFRSLEILTTPPTP